MSAVYTISGTKSHISNDNQKTLCGQAVSNAATGTANCKRCLKISEKNQPVEIVEETEVVVDELVEEVKGETQPKLNVVKIKYLDNGHNMTLIKRCDTEEEATELVAHYVENEDDYSNVWAAFTDDQRSDYFGSLTVVVVNYDLPELPEIPENIMFQLEHGNSDIIKKTWARISLRNYNCPKWVLDLARS